MILFNCLSRILKRSLPNRIGTDFILIYYLISILKLKDTYVKNLILIKLKTSMHFNNWFLLNIFLITEIVENHAQISLQDQFFSNLKHIMGSPIFSKIKASGHESGEREWVWQFWLI